MKKLEKIFRVLIYTLPLCLFFSYYPIISFGSSESMNFELSIPLVWLVLFDFVAFIMMIKKKKLFQDFRKKWVWLLFPGFVTISVLWSLNSLRGILTVGILWLIYFAGYGMYSFRNIFRDEGFRKVFIRWFFGSTIFICGWCILQCILDLVGVSRNYTLMCAGCTYEMFGFPHPNGFAIEPQFMGNLLLAPGLVAAWMYTVKPSALKYGNLILLCFFIIAATLFLTFSRGAIYAFIVAMVFMSVFLMVREKKERKNIVKRAGIVWGAIILSFLFTLNLQGIMAEVSMTNDTYQSGVAKVLNHLSLGVIDVREEKKAEEVEAPEVEDKKEAVFSGYVESSTEIRVKVSEAAIEVLKNEPLAILFGVGIGGAGQALYVNNLSPSPKEIIQNQYVSLLLEVGIVGLALMILTIVLIIRAVIKGSSVVIMLTLMLAYGITLVFFSGLPNALQIYSIPMTLFFILDGGNN